MVLYEKATRVAFLRSNDSNDDVCAINRGNEKILDSTR